LVQREERLHDRRRLLAAGRVGHRLDFLEQSLDCGDELARLGLHCGAHRPYPCSPNIGWWTVRSVLPLPRYMWTPHGRHGSNERTARMMSMPRKFSWSFSSKIGWPITASS